MKKGFSVTRNTFRTQVSELRLGPGRSFNQNSSSSLLDSINTVPFGNGLPEDTASALDKLVCAFQIAIEKVLDFG